MAFYDDNYRIVADYALYADKPVKLSDHGDPADRRCRFCGRGKSETTFKNRAHAVPEFLGNRSLLSMNECDACNKLFAMQYEDHLAKWLGPGRAICRIPGKRGVPTYKTDDIRIETGDAGLHFEIYNPGALKETDFPKDKSFSFELPVETPTQPYIPIRAAQALIKAACSIAPARLLPECEMAIAWLMNRCEVRFHQFSVLYSFTPGTNPYGPGKAMLIERTSAIDAPYLWLILATANFRFQILVPFCRSDPWWHERRDMKFTSKHFPIPFGNSYEERFGRTTFGVLNWSSDVPETMNPHVSMHVDKANRIR